MAASDRATQRLCGRWPGCRQRNTSTIRVTRATRIHFQVVFPIEAGTLIDNANDDFLRETLELQSDSLVLMLWELKALLDFLEPAFFSFEPRFFRVADTEIAMFDSVDKQFGESHDHLVRVGAGLSDQGCELCGFSQGADALWENASKPTTASNCLPWPDSPTDIPTKIHRCSAIAMLIAADRQRNGQPAAVDENVKLASGTLEGSNVNVTDAMVNLISLSRQFELQIKMMQTADQNAQRADQLLSLNG